MPITKETPSSKQLIRAFEPYKESQGEEYMSDKMRAHFTGILNKWKQELREEVDRTVHHMQDEAANFPDPADRASQEEEFALELRARDRERKLIKKIEEALERIAEGEYGCGNGEGDTGGNQAVFNGGGAGLVLDETRNEVGHVVCPSRRG